MHKNDSTSLPEHRSHKENCVLYVYCAAVQGGTEGAGAEAEGINHLGAGL